MLGVVIILVPVIILQNPRLFCVLSVVTGCARHRITMGIALVGFFLQLLANRRVQITVMVHRFTCRVI